MEGLRQFIDLFIHLDRHLTEITRDYGPWTYAILFAIIFCETGLVVTPLLPGDSLLFTAGAIASLGSLDVTTMIVLLIIAAVLGDLVNYWVGHWMGPAVFRHEDGWIFKKEYLERTHRFYERYGAKTIVIARFVPIVRTFAPFVAGVGRMTYWRFAVYNVTGGILWVLVCVLAGYYFGNIPVVKRNFTLVIMAIILLSILPVVIEVVRERRRPGPAVPGPDSRRIAGETEG